MFLKEKDTWRQKGSYKSTDVTTGNEKLWEHTGSPRWKGRPRGLKNLYIQAKRHWPKIRGREKKKKKKFSPGRSEKILEKKKGKAKSKNESGAIFQGQKERTEGRGRQRKKHREQLLRSVDRGWLKQFLVFKQAYQSRSQGPRMNIQK